MPKIIAVTVMRKDSRRFPDKGIHPFLGIPLYMHTVNFALQLGFPYYFITDYENLSLPIDVNRFMATSKDCNTGKEVQRFDADIFVLLQVTSPLRDLDSVRSAISVFEVSKKSVAVSVRTLNNKYCYMHGEGINFIQKFRAYEGCERYNIKYETGSFFIFSREQIEKKHILDAHPNDILLCEDSFDIDIDYLEDITRIEERLGL